ncbi:hypothetical protein T265_03709 [Opisthorchis viverrini]|uniref:Uncharacterized protein n=1 Tax=Opisthorchis viverrini TaxID=6198 RepID=A0A074ZRJ3_OPIVI|nr:hypothetical protein T265_03709 [Opisthorchis viverrini]KER29691.1 hypothetical protein T265_03709 [Opisthorchis viverrini]
MSFTTSCSRNSANLYAEHLTKPAQPKGCYQFIFDVPKAASDRRNMRGFAILCLVVFLFVAYCEARPEAETNQKLRESGVKLIGTMRTAMMKMYEKGKSRFMAYMERDNLGEKIAAVLEIHSFSTVMQRLTKRIEGYLVRSSVSSNIQTIMRKAQKYVQEPHADRSSAFVSRASLAETLLSLFIDACCVSETCLQDPTSVVHFKQIRTSSDVPHFPFLIFGDAEAIARGINGVGVALSPKADSASVQKKHIQVVDFVVDAQRTDNGEGLIQLCANRRLFRASTNFQHKCSHRITRTPPTAMVMNSWLSVTDGELQLKIVVPCGATSAIELNWPRKPLGTQSQADDEDCLEVEWRLVKGPVLSDLGNVCPSHLIRLHGHWTASRSADFVAVRKAIPATREHDGACGSLKHWIIRNLKDGGRWWISKAEEMGKALLQLIRSTGQKKTSVNQTIREKEGTAMHSQTRFEQSAEHFKGQFGQSPPEKSSSCSTLLVPSCHNNGRRHEGWDTASLPNSREEQSKRVISILQREKAPGPDGLQASLFKGGEVPVNSLTTILQKVWNENRIPVEWSSSIVISVLRNRARRSS